MHTAVQFLFRSLSLTLEDKPNPLEDASAPRWFTDLLAMGGDLELCDSEGKPAMEIALDWKRSKQAPEAVNAALVAGGLDFLVQLKEKFYVDRKNFHVRSRTQQAFLRSDDVVALTRKLLGTP